MLAGRTTFVSFPKDIAVGRGGKFNTSLDVAPRSKAACDVRPEKVGVSESAGINRLEKVGVSPRMVTFHRDFLEKVTMRAATVHRVGSRHGVCLSESSQIFRFMLVRP